LQNIDEEEEGDEQVAEGKDDKVVREA